MKRGRLPLTALRSFEAAGRHLSFSRAADELFVSQAAISRQVRELEQLLGTPLFRRLHRKVELTAAGQDLLADLTPTFDEISGALDRITAKNRNVVRLTIDPAIASLWLVPRLDRFRQFHPDIELMLMVETRIIDFRTGEADIGLRFSRNQTSWPATDAILLQDAWETPMLAPALAARTALKRPADLLGAELLHEETRQHWRTWFKAAGVDESQTRSPSGPLLVDPTLTRQSALLGHGVALGDLLLMEDDLRGGGLTIPFPIFLRVGAYWVVTQRFDALTAQAQAVVDWLRAEARATASFVESVTSIVNVNA